MMIEKKTKPFGWSDKIGYMFGDFGNDFTFIFASSFLMIFYTKVLGIPAEMVGTLFLIARFVDAFTDVTMGRIVDKLRPGKDGRFRPWLRYICGPVALASFLMYQSALAAAPMTVRIIYMYVTYILWGSVFYTAINIPYGSMASVLSPDANDRAALSTFRSIGATLANLVIGVGAPLLLYTTDAFGNQVVDGRRFTIIAGVFSVAAVICYLLCYFLTTERVVIAPQEEPEGGTLQNLSALLKNRALLGIIVAAILLLLASLLSQSVNQYVFIDYFKSREAVSVMSICGLLPTLLLVPFIGPVAKKYGKKEISAAGCIVGGAATLFLYWAQVKSVVTYIAISTIGYLGFGFFNLVIWAIITDVIDDWEVRTGQREDGTIYAVYSFARKIGQALAGGLGGFALGLVGYDSQVQVQTAKVARGIYNIATLVPGLLYIGVGLALIFLYPLGKRKVEENIVTLKERHKEI